MNRLSSYVDGWVEDVAWSAPDRVCIACMEVSSGSWRWRFASPFAAEWMTRTLNGDWRNRGAYRSGDARRPDWAHWVRFRDWPRVLLLARRVRRAERAQS